MGAAKSESIYFAITMISSVFTHLAATMLVACVHKLICSCTNTSMPELNLNCMHASMGQNPRWAPSMTLLSHMHSATIRACTLDACMCMQ